MVALENMQLYMYFLSVALARAYNIDNLKAMKITHDSFMDEKYKITATERNAVTFCTF